MKTFIFQKENMEGDFKILTSGEVVNVLPIIGAPRSLPAFKAGTEAEKRRQAFLAKGSK